MSKKWTEAYPRDNAIVDYKQFNQGYNAFKSSFNGNIDRTMMPAAAVNKTRIKDKAFHYVQVFRRGEMQELIDPNTPADSRDFEGLSYNTYGGGPVDRDWETPAHNETLCLLCESC